MKLIFKTDNERTVNLNICWFYLYFKFHYFPNSNMTYGTIICKIWIKWKYLLAYKLRWYVTPCNIHSDERILNYDYNHGFENFKICSNCPQNAFRKFYKKSKNRCNIWTHDPQIVSLPFNRLSYTESYQVINYCTNKISLKIN